MTTQQAVEAVKKLQRTMYAHEHAQGILYLDSVTAAPEGTAEARGQTLGVLSEEDHALFVNDAVRETLETLAAHRDELDAQTAREAEVLSEDFQRMTRIPAKEYAEYAMLLNEAGSVWHKAKETDDYALFKPVLQRVIETNRRFAAYIDPDKAPYDALLGQYEKGMTTALLDPYFTMLRRALPPLIEKAKRRTARTDFLHRTYPVEGQRRLTDKLMELMGIDRAHCGVGETEHPFTINFSKYDVRITTHYHENELASSLYSVIHEGGHALYELHTGDELQYGCLAGGCGMSLHESQSRMYENMIGRSEAFIEAAFPLMKEIFPEQLGDVTAREMYLAVNQARPSLVRTEADELTYSLHILIRYELEKRLIDGTLTVDDLPGEWNRLYRETLGVEPANDREGVLQDSHWSGGMIGYFPSYALGNAYAAQLMARMRSEIDVDAALRAGRLQPINDWLDSRLHRFGKLYDPIPMFEKAAGAPFDPRYYIDYLTEKFGR